MFEACASILFSLLHSHCSYCFVGVLFVVKSNNSCLLNFSNAEGVEENALPTVSMERWSLVGMTCGKKLSISVDIVFFISLEANFVIVTLHILEQTLLSTIGFGSTWSFCL